MQKAIAKVKESLPVSGGVINRRGVPLLVPSAIEGGALVSARGENFLFAGSSAFLLLVANLFPHYWSLSFFALTPFLWRLIRVDALGALQLGFLFGFSFFSIYKLPGFLTAPVLTLLTVALGSVLFAIFAWAVARAKEKLGFNPVFVALLWVLFELALLKILITTAGENLQVHPTGFFHGLSVLFGFLAVTFLIVLVNSILVFAIEKIVSLAKARGAGSLGKIKCMGPCSHTRAFHQKVYLVLSGRSPPIDWI